MLQVLRCSWWVWIGQISICFSTKNCDFFDKKLAGCRFLVRKNVPARNARDQQQGLGGPSLGSCRHREPGTPSPFFLLQLQSAITHQKSTLFDPGEIEKNEGASPPVLVVGPDWLDLDLFSNTCFRGWFQIWGSAQKRAPRAWGCLLYTSPSPRDATLARMPSSA